ncbi:MAG: cytochrome c oxidase subunit 3 [Actinomycetota bacterium]|nr:cytochrome c oxidase subunit 3 [Actinomycetota bacterium]
MTAVIPAGPVRHVEDVDAVGRRWRLGVLLLLLADASFVASLVFTYFYLRGLNTDSGWFPDGAASAPIWVGWTIAAGSVLSAVAYRWGQSGIQAGNEARLVRGAALAVVVLVVIAVGQLIQLATFPFSVDENSYASTTYALGAANMFHILLTLFVGIGIWNRARLHKFSATNNWQVQITGLWWTWIAAAAVLSAFTTSFVASPNVLVGNG